MVELSAAVGRWCVDVTMCTCVLGDHSAGSYLLLQLLVPGLKPQLQVKRLLCVLKRAKRRWCCKSDGAGSNGGCLSRPK